MKNRIKIMFNALKEHNTNLSMFIKVLDNKTAMILLAEKESVNKDNDNDNGNNLFIITDAINLSNIYKEEYSDIVLPINDNYDKQEIENCVISRLERIVVLKAYNVLENNMESIKDVILVDANKNILSDGMTKTKESKCPVCGSNFH